MIVRLRPDHADQLQVPHDGGERGAQLVLRGGEEVGLHLVQLPQPAHRLPLLFEESRVLDGDRGVVGECGERSRIGVGDAVGADHRDRSGDSLPVEHRHDERHLRPRLVTRRRVIPATGETRSTSLQHVGHHRWSQVKPSCSACAVGAHARGVTPGTDHEPVVLARQERGLGAGTGQGRGRGADRALQAGHTGGRGGECSGDLVKARYGRVDVVDVALDLAAHLVDLPCQHAQLVA